ncbi:hypothetical protein CGMCC3_g13147 [Colletotrichum fructicola]|nr:uncharacterized protein CGMCC3_g13147 [Colletotrichum fructicola]KAE9570638.1 hypothetical protein CGMCC3_g13147 [Colletotrichum fructicola]
MALSHPPPDYGAHPANPSPFHAYQAPQTGQEAIPSHPVNHLPLSPHVNLQSEISTSLPPEPFHLLHH